MSKRRISVVGLGYVGLPLAVQFSTKFDVIGFDINVDRVRELSEGIDSTLEVSSDRLREARGRLSFTSNASDLTKCDFHVVAVPTPITRNKEPDLRPLEGACAVVGGAIKTGHIVVFESTVYPGCTEEFCVPLLEQKANLKLNQDFYVGYSPERINPGDPVHTVQTIVKVVSGSTPETTSIIDNVYSSIIPAGTYRAPSIRVAEAAKVIENTQRDLNIAFVNELAVMFERMGLDTASVLEAAGTKWNFLPFRPGLVGGHCIGVDPFYLTYKAREVGHHPEIILAGRRLNDSMGNYIASQVVKLLIRKGFSVARSKVLILGVTFKENCPDIRNTRVVDVVSELEQYGCEVHVYDPWANQEDVLREYGIRLVAEIDRTVRFDAVVLAVAHKQFQQILPSDVVVPGGAVYDVKSFWPVHEVDKRL